MKRITKDIEFEIARLAGGDPIRFSLRPLTQWEAAAVFHEVLQPAVSAFGSMLGPGKVNAEAINVGDAIKNLVASIPFSKVEYITRAVMRGAVVDGEEIKDLDNMTIFDDEPTALYVMLFHAIKGNWPGVFSYLAGRLGSFQPQGEAAEKQGG